MKASDFLKNVLNKAEVEIDSATEAQIMNNFAALDVPDTIIEPVMNNIITRNQAKVDKDIAERHKNKVYENLTKSQTNALLAAGYTEDEVALVNNLPLEDRVRKIIEINTNKVSSKFSASETEQIALAKKQAEAEKARADEYQSKILKKEEEYRARENDLKNEFQFDTLLDVVPYKKDGIPKRNAMDILKRETQAWLSARNAAVVFVDGRARTVNADDHSEDYYDENNKPVVIERVMLRLAQSMNLVGKEAIEPKQEPGTKKKTISFHTAPSSASDYFRNFTSSLMQKR